MIESHKHLHLRVFDASQNMIAHSECECKCNTKNLILADTGRPLHGPFGETSQIRGAVCTCGEHFEPLTSKVDSACATRIKFSQMTYNHR